MPYFIPKGRIFLTYVFRVTAESLFLFSAYFLIIIITTSLAGGLLCPCKGLNTGMALTRSYESKVLNRTSFTSLSPSRGCFLFAFNYWLIRKRVNILLQAYLIICLILLYLVSDVFFNFFHIFPDRIHIISPTPEFSIFILWFQYHFFFSIFKTLHNFRISFPITTCLLVY